VDFLKYDFCFHPMTVRPDTLYKRMALALANCGRDILFSACSWGTENTKKWIKETGADMWRSTGDIYDSWQSIKGIVQSQLTVQEYNGKGCFNDMDMLVVGMNNQGNVSLGGCTEDEYRLHFSLWAFLQSPLMIGCDIRHMDEATRSILLNKAVIALNQDESCHQAYIANNPLQAFGTNEQHVTPTVNRQPEEPFYHYSDYCLSRSILVRRLADGDMAVIRLNFRDHETSNAPTVITPDMLGLPEDCTARMQVTDLWTGEEIALVHGTIPNPGIPPHGCQVLRIHLHD
jgi:alpha-galactosidase